MFKKHKKSGETNEEENDKENITEESIRKLFENNPDVVLQTFEFDENTVTFVTCEGLVDAEVINTVIFERFVLFFNKKKNKLLSEDDIKKSLYVPGLQRINSKKKMIAEVFAGRLIVLFHKEQFLFSIDIAKRPQRNPEETSTEVSIKGP